MREKKWLIFSVLPWYVHLDLARVIVQIQSEYDTKERNQS